MRHANEQNVLGTCTFIVRTPKWNSLLESAVPDIYNLGPRGSNIDNIFKLNSAAATSLHSGN